MNKIDILIPVFIDHDDRIKNCDIVINYLSTFDFINIYIHETYKDTRKLENRYNNIKYFSETTNLDYYNKMYAFNFLSRKSNEEIIGLYDVDVLVLSSNFKIILNVFKDKVCDVLYPYDGNFYNVPKEIVEKLKINSKTEVDLNKCTLFNSNSRGGAVFFNKNVYFEGGLSNEYFKNVGYDDDEIFNRFKILDYKVARTKTPLLHLDHFRGKTSYNFNNYTENNQKVLNETSKRNKEQLKEYIKTWNWVNVNV